LGPKEPARECKNEEEAGKTPVSGVEATVPARVQVASKGSEQGQRHSGSPQEKGLKGKQLTESAAFSEKPDLDCYSRRDAEELWRVAV
jgi:hypothetical protein